MPDRENVIKELENAPNTVKDGFYYLRITHKLRDDAIDLLKEQEAKVLTVDQLEDALDTVVWLETPVSENLADGYSLIMAYSHKYGYMFFDSPFGDNPSQDRLEYSEYGRSWRCWDRRPSEEQRNAVKWE